MQNISVLSHLDLFLSIQPITGYLTAGNLKYKTALEAVHLSSAAWRECVKVLSISKCVNVYKDTSEDMFLLLYLSFWSVLSSHSQSLSATTTSQAFVTPGDDSGQCTTCQFRQQSKLMRLHSIKSQILSILRLEQAPNISRDTVKLLLPKAPPLQELLDQYDQNGGISENEEQGSSETIITMATECKYHSVLQYIVNPKIFGQCMSLKCMLS